MTTPAGGSAGSAPAREHRERISCPGCGRHDWVTWPGGEDPYHWKCFNCGKQFDLRRGGKH